MDELCDDLEEIVEEVNVDQMREPATKSALVQATYYTTAAIKYLMIKHLFTITELLVNSYLNKGDKVWDKAKDKLLFNRITTFTNQCEHTRRHKRSTRTIHKIPTK